MKRFVSVVLSLAILLSMISVLSFPAAAENEYPAYLSPEEHKDVWTIEGFACYSHPGGKVNASDLELGKSYFFENDVILNLDRELECPVLYADGGITIRGGGKLESLIIYAVGVLLVDSAVIRCGTMQDPPDPSTTVHNGITGCQGVEILDGDITCPVISGGGETVTVNRGSIKAEKISAHLGYSQYGGTVETDSLWAMDGIAVGGGELKMGVGKADFYFLDGGAVEGRFDGIGEEERSGRILLSFPMRIVAPEDCVCRDGHFRDLAGKPVAYVRVEEQHVSHPFRDVHFEDYYYDSMVWAYERNPRITDGVSADSFAPHRPCTRGQAVTFLWRALDCPEPASSATPFRDLKKGAFYEKAVAWAVENNITNGTDETHFSPDAVCTRAQIVTLIWRAAGCPEPESMTTPFTDVKAGSYYEKAVASVTEYGITNGVAPDRFGPDTICTRGQIVTFLYRAGK